MRTFYHNNPKDELLPIDASLRAGRRQNVAFLAVSYGLLIFGLFPGRFDYDSVLQYFHGSLFNFYDWLPPIMSLLLGILRPLSAGPAPMFVLQLTVYFVGVFLLSDSLVVAGRKHWAHVLSAMMMLPIVSFNFLDVQKDALFCAMTVLLIGVFARRIVAPRPANIPELIAVFLVLVLMWDLRKNSLFLIVPFGFGVTYFVCGIQTNKIKSGCVTTLFLVGSLLIQQAVVYDVLQTRSGHAVISTMLFDFAGISSRLGTDASTGLLGSNFLADIPQCYRPKSVDNFMPWGPCKQRAMLLQEKFESSKERNLAISTWLAAIVRHPVAYLEHRWAYFAGFMRISCRDCPEPMNLGVRAERPYHVWQPGVRIDFDASPRVTTLGLFLERVAMMSYSSALSRGFYWLIILAASVVIVAVKWWKGVFDDFDLLTGIAAVGGLSYAIGFFFVGVSDSQRYLHPIYALGLISTCLALRDVSRANVVPPIRAAWVTYGKFWGRTNLG